MMIYSLKQAKRVWHNVLPFGCIFIAWGFMNGLLFQQLNNSIVIPEQVNRIWLINIALFIFGGFAVVVYLSVKTRREAAILEETLEVMPCAVLLGDSNGKVELFNSKARELIQSGILGEINDQRKWHQKPVELGGMTFDSFYSTRNMHFAVNDRRFTDKRKKVYGNAVLLYDVTQLWSNNKHTGELVQLLRDLNGYLGKTTASLTESIQALAKSTINQATAFQTLANYVYDIANDVETDAAEIQKEIAGLSGNIRDCSQKQHEHLRKLNESAALMQKSHEAATLASTRLAKLNNIQQKQADI